MEDVKLRTVIVDDEPLARDRLRALLSAHADVDVIAECGDGREAVDAIRHLQPDVVFLDVRMPEMDAFEVLETLGPMRTFDLIFLTAHDAHAVRAFETRAMDYLLKPVSRARLSEALNRVRERRRSSGAARRIVVRDGGRVVFVAVRDIEWIESAGNYAVLHTDTRTHVVRETMNALERFLKSEGFLRVSRGAIVNLARVREIRTGETSIAVMESGGEVVMKRPVREVAALVSAACGD